MAANRAIGVARGRLAAELGDGVAERGAGNMDEPRVRGIKFED
jgi:hypothetical protein